MKNIMEFLKGKKTYIIAVLMILLGYLTEDNTMIMNGLAFIGLRTGLNQYK